MLMANMIFKRVEKKYMISEDKLSEMLERMKDIVREDEYGLSTISNIYYDTPNSDLIVRSLEKPAYKEKLRLRVYGNEVNDDTKAFIEIKKKYDGVVYKRRIQHPLGDAVKYLNHRQELNDDSQIKKEIDYFLNFYNVIPKMMIAYDRVAYVGIQDSSLRMTVDRNIRYRTRDLNLKEGSRGKEILPKGYVLIELKVPGAYPIEISRILDELGIYSTSYSKYGRAYKEYMENKRVNRGRILALGNYKEKEKKICLQAL